jgi:hypothetical protein
MRSKGGGKHDILSVGRATATTLDCLWMWPRDTDADMCPGTETAPVSTEECIAYQSCVSATGVTADPTVARAGARFRRFMYVERMEAFVARTRKPRRPIRRAR